MHLLIILLFKTYAYFMKTAYFSSVLEDSVEIFFTDVTCIVIKAATNKTFLQLNLTNTKHLNGSVYFYYNI